MTRRAISAGHYLGERLERVQRVGKKSRTELDEALAELADLKNKVASGAHAAADEKLSEVGRCRLSP